MKYKTHKVSKSERTACGLSLFDTMRGSEFWKDVDCKMCLNHKRVR